MHKENVVNIYIYLRVLYRLRMEGHPSVCDNRDESVKYYAELYQSQLDKICMIPLISHI